MKFQFRTRRFAEHRPLTAVSAARCEGLATVVVRPFLSTSFVGGGIFCLFFGIRRSGVAEPMPWCSVRCCVCVQIYVRQVVVCVSACFKVWTTQSLDGGPFCR